MAQSQAVVQVSLFDQDLLVTTGVSNLVQRLSAQVILPTPNSLVYSGYTTATLTSFTALLPAGAVCAFAYLRNVGTNAANPLIVETQPTGGTATALNLYPGGMFLYANSVAIQTPAPSTLSTVSYAVFVNAPTAFEYLIVY